MEFQVSLMRTFEYFSKKGTSIILQGLFTMQGLKPKSSFFRKPLTAEGHDVVHLSSNTVVQIVFGVKDTVWIVQENPNEFGDHCLRIVNHSKSQYIL